MQPTRALLAPVKKGWKTGLLWKPQKWSRTRKRNWRERNEGTADVAKLLRRAAGEEQRLSGVLQRQPAPHGGLGGGRGLATLAARAPRVGGLAATLGRAPDRGLATLA